MRSALTYDRDLGELEELKLLLKDAAAGYICILRKKSRSLYAE